MSDTPQNPAPADSGAAGQAPQPSERESQLESQLKTATKDRDAAVKERDKLKSQVGTVTSERDEARETVKKITAELRTTRTERDDYQAKYEEATKPATAPEGAAEQGAPAGDADPHANTKALLIRHGLKAAYILPDDSVCFDEAHAKHVAGDKFDSLTKISVE